MIGDTLMTSMVADCSKLLLQRRGTNDFRSD